MIRGAPARARHCKIPQESWNARTDSPASPNSRGFISSRGRGWCVKLLSYRRPVEIWSFYRRWSKKHAEEMEQRRTQQQRRQKLQVWKCWWTGLGCRSSPRLHTPLAAIPVHLPRFAVPRSAKGPQEYHSYRGYTLPCCADLRLMGRHTDLPPAEGKVWHPAHYAPPGGGANPVCVRPARLLGFEKHVRYPKKDPPRRRVPDALFH